ncbi:helix-turn-helix domain-containing protein [Pseudomonas sihuiensis]|uniref:helix-turn-helix domain-containing protein n=1 Tax=Pseudomonas sihuiensis TaxID=1274359 RepID=UPI001E4713E9|nr:helix-turn-helix transcriptional regulator [Pseudomonas sihuiensis]
MPLFGERLRAERERLGLGQQEMAEKCGVTMRSQRNYEKGERQPDAAYLAAFTALGGDVLFLLTGHGDQKMTDQSYRSTATDMTENTNPVTHSVAAEPLGEYRLNRREKALLENYRGSDEEGRRAMESTASALAHRDSAKKKGRQGVE